MKNVHRSCLLAAALVLPLVTAGASLPVLNFQPVLLLPEALRLDSVGKDDVPYRLWIYMGDPALRPVTTKHRFYLMPVDGRASTTRLPRFFLRLQPEVPSVPMLDIYLTGTNDACVLTRPTDRPGRTVLVGRLFNVAHQLTFSVLSQTPQAGSIGSFCAVDQGGLNIVFGKPARTQVDMTVVTQDLAGKDVSAYQVTLPLGSIEAETSTP